MVVGVVRLETATYFSSKEVEQRFMKGLSMDSFFLRTVKNSPELRVGPKTSM